MNINHKQAQFLQWVLDTTLKMEDVVGIKKIYNRGWYETGEHEFCQYLLEEYGSEYQGELPEFDIL